MTTQSINGWIDKPLEGFYAHIYSNGHSVKNLFETEEDRIFGMNLLPIAAHACDVSLLGHTFTRLSVAGRKTARE